MVDDVDARVDLKRTVERLRAVSGRTSLEVAVRSGRLLAEVLFDGEIDAWRDRGDRLVGDLAAQEDAPSPATLYRALAAFELYSRMGAAFRLDRLNTSHLRAVTGLPLPLQEQLLARAADLRWSAKMLKAEAKPHLAKVRGRRGRPKSDPVLRALTGAQKQLEVAMQEAERPEHEVDPQEHVRMLTTVERLLEDCARLRSRLFPKPQRVRPDGETT